MKIKLLSHPVVRYVVAGGLAYLVEIICLLTLHKAGLSAELSTALAYWVGFPAAFLLQKILAFKDYERTLKTISKQIISYSALVIFNYIFTLVIVSLLPDKWLIFSRTLALVITTVWNYLLYHYIFSNKERPSKAEIVTFFSDAVRLKNNRVNLALLTIPIIIFCAPLIMTGNKIAPGDPDYYFQIYEAFRRSILDFGQFPWWNGWVAGGIPLFGNIQFGLVSIQAPLVLMFGAVLGMKVAVLSYQIIGFFGFRKLFKDGFGAPTLRATLLAYIPIFGSFFSYRVMAGHFTFLMIAFVPWLLYFFLKRTHKYSWVGFALTYSIMVWSSPHYTTIMSAAVVGFWFLYEIISNTIRAWRAKNWPDYWKDIKFDALFFTKAGALILALIAYRMIFVAQFIRDFPRLETASNESFTGVLRGFYAIWGPDQFGNPPKLPSGWGWEEASTYIGIGTLICLIIVLGVWTSKIVAKKKAPFNYSIILLLALFLSFFILGMADFGTWSPYHVLNKLPVFDSMRVATRWLLWSSLLVLAIIAAYKGTRFSRTINILLVLTVIELFIGGTRVIGSRFTVAAEQYRSPQAEFNQMYHYRTPRPAYMNDPVFLATFSYDENLYETTRNNYGQVIAGDSLVDTRQPNSTVRCGENQGACKFLSDNAKLIYWSPNKIILARIGPGPININMNPGNGWRANGKYIFAKYKVTDPLKTFIIEDQSPVITLDYSPKFSPSWVLHKIGL